MSHCVLPASVAPPPPPGAVVATARRRVTSHTATSMPSTLVPLITPTARNTQRSAALHRRRRRRRCRGTGCPAPLPLPLPALHAAVPLPHAAGVPVRAARRASTTKAASSDTARNPAAPTTPASLIVPGDPPTHTKEGAAAAAAQHARTHWNPQKGLVKYCGEVTNDVRGKIAERVKTNGCLVTPPPQEWHGIAVQSASVCATATPPADTAPQPRAQHA